MLVTRQLTVAIGFQNIYYLFYFFLLWNSMSAADYQHSSKYLMLCSAEERHFRFGTTWGWIL